MGREEVSGCEESPENVLIKRSTKGSNRGAVLLLCLELGGAMGGSPRERGSVVTGLPRTAAGSRGHIWLVGFVLCLICLKLVSKRYFVCFRKHKNKKTQNKQSNRLCKRKP